MFFDAEGVRENGGAAAIGEAAQHSLPTGIVEVLFLVGAAGVPLRQVIEDVVGQRGGGAAEGAAGHIAEGVVAAGIALPALRKAGGPQGDRSIRRDYVLHSNLSSASTATPSANTSTRKPTATP